MPQYGVWLEQGDMGTGIAIKRHPGEPVPDLPERQVSQFVWRGIADNRVEAVRAAQAEWKRRCGTTARGGRCYVEEIEPGDSGYEAR
jgi:hypothetical protein